MDLKRLLGALDVLGCVALYMVVGPALILVNKQLMTSYGFPYPMLISGIGQVSSAIGSFFVVKVFQWQPLSDQAKSISWDFYRKNMVVVGAAFAASLCFCPRGSERRFTATGDENVQRRRPS